MQPKKKIPKHFGVDGGTPVEIWALGPPSKKSRSSETQDPPPQKLQKFRTLDSPMGQ